MALDTYDDLRESIASWAIRDDLALLIPDFIKLAETRINEELRTRSMITTLDGGLTLSDSVSGVIPVPENFVGIHLLQVNGLPLELRPYEEAIEAARSLNINGVPSIYTIVGESIRTFPIQDTEYAYKLEYYRSLIPLSESNSYNWLLVRSPGIYLHASLAELWDHLQDDARRDSSLSRYADLRDRLMMSDAASKIPTGPLIQRVR